MSKLELGRVHMTVKVMDDKVEYRPKERVCVVMIIVVINK